MSFELVNVFSTVYKSNWVVAIQAALSKRKRKEPVVSLIIESLICLKQNYPKCKLRLKQQTDWTARVRNLVILTCLGFSLLTSALKNCLPRYFFFSNFFFNHRPCISSIYMKLHSLQVQTVELKESVDCTIHWDGNGFEKVVILIWLLNLSI